MAPIPMPIGYPIGCGLYTHLRGMRRPPRCGACSLPGSRCLFPIGSIHPSILIEGLPAVNGSLLTTVAVLLLSGLLDNIYI